MYVNVCSIALRTCRGQHFRSCLNAKRALVVPTKRVSTSVSRPINVLPALLFAAIHSARAERRAQHRRMAEHLQRNVDFAHTQLENRVVRDQRYGTVRPADVSVKSHRDGQ